MFTRRIPLGRSFTDPAFVSSLLGVSFGFFLVALGVAAFLVGALDYALFAPSHDVSFVNRDGSALPPLSPLPVGPSSSPSSSTTTTTTVASNAGFGAADHWARFQVSMQLPLYVLFVPSVAASSYSPSSSPSPSAPSSSSTVASPPSINLCRVIAARTKEFIEGSPPCDTAEGLWFCFLQLTTSGLFGWLLAWQVQRRRFVLDFVVSVYLGYMLLGWVLVGVCPLGQEWWWVGSLLGIGVSFAVASHWSIKWEMQQIDIGGSSAA